MIDDAYAEIEAAQLIYDMRTEAGLSQRDPCEIGRYAIHTQSDCIGPRETISLPQPGNDMREIGAAAVPRQNAATRLDKRR